MTDHERDAGSARKVDSVETTIDIIGAIQELNGATLTDLAEHLDLSKSAVHSHLHTLESREMLTRQGYEYRPSYRFIDIGETLKRVHYDLYRYGREAAKSLADETDESVQLVIEEHGVGVHVFKSSDQQGIFTDKYPVGHPTPLYCMAAGKAILAHLDEEQIDAIIEQGLEPITDQTIDDADNLREELEEIREEGTAYSSEEAVRGMRGVAAPVLDAKGNPLGSVNISGPISRIKGDLFNEKLPQKVRETSNVIEVTILNQQEFSPTSQTD